MFKWILNNIRMKKRDKFWEVVRESDMLTILLYAKKHKIDSRIVNMPITGNLSMLWITSNRSCRDSSSIEKLNALIALGADVNVKSMATGKTALVMTVELQSPLVAEILLEAGADPFIETDAGHNIFHYIDELCTEEQKHVFMDIINKYIDEPQMTLEERLNTFDADLRYTNVW